MKQCGGDGRVPGCRRDSSFPTGLSGWRVICAGLPGGGRIRVQMEEPSTRAVRLPDSSEE